MFVQRCKIFYLFVIQLFMRSFMQTPEKWCSSRHCFPREIGPTDGIYMSPCQQPENRSSCCYSVHSCEFQVCAVGMQREKNRSFWIPWNEYSIKKNMVAIYYVFFTIFKCSHVMLFHIPYETLWSFIEDRPLV